MLRLMSILVIKFSAVLTVRETTGPVKAVALRGAELFFLHSPVFQGEGLL